MARPRKTDYPAGVASGRPPKNPMEKVGRPVRALVTQPVMLAIEQAMKLSGTNLSETFRLAIFMFLESKGLMTAQLRDDPTFETLREKGLV